MYIGGLDIGTTGCKLVLFDECGKQVLRAYREYEVMRNGGLHEVNISAVYTAVSEILAESAPFDVKAVGVTSFGESFVILDENNNSLAPTLLYTDPRGKEEVADIEERFGKEAIAFKTGTVMHEMYSLPKLMWLKRHSPTAFERAKCILLMQDYIVYMLSGVRQIDYSLAARTAAFDIEKKCWIKELFDFAGVDVKLMSTPVPSGTAAGKICPKVAKELGISEDITVVCGCQDQIAALLGAGVTEEGQAMDGIGTVECVPFIMSEIPKDMSIYSGGYSVVPHVGGGYACYILSYAGGATLKWFRDKLANESYAELDAKVPQEPTELLVMPHFAGAATPYMDQSSRAAILGLTFEHTKADIYKALMEGTSYEILLNLKEMEKFGISLKEIVATGGGANSDVWLQIKADIFGIPVKALDGSEIGAAGTAVLAGKAVGVYKSNCKLIGEKKIFYPNVRKNNFYNKQYKKYARIYQAVREVMKNE